MKSINDCRLYGILDTGYVRPENMLSALQQMIDGGIDIVQVRAKNFAPDEIRDWLDRLHAATQQAKIPLIVNDFPELSAQADGVHVGQEDASAATVRSHLGSRLLLGKSTHSLAQAEAAARESVDYLGFGPLFPTLTKAGRPAIGLAEIAEVHRRVKIPIFCIGGVKRENLPDVIKAGAQRVVIVSGILQAVDIAAYVADCKRLLAAAD